MYINYAVAYRLVVESHEAVASWLPLIRSILVIEEVKLLHLSITLQQLQQTEPANITSVRTLAGELLNNYEQLNTTFTSVLFVLFMLTIQNSMAFTENIFF